MCFLGLKGEELLAVSCVVVDRNSISYLRLCLVILFVENKSNILKSFR